jgi:hypothetical protein
VLAGKPFYISPVELYDMDGPDLTFWFDLAMRRMNMEQENGG